LAPEDKYPEQGTQYAAFLDGELKRENDRRSSLLTRASTAVTASTGLVTLVLALFTVVIGKDPSITGAAKWGVTVAVVSLLGSAACALEAGRPKKNREQTAISTLKSLIDDTNWRESEVNARWQTANITIDQIEKLRSGSKKRGWWLRAAGICQVLAVAALAFSTVLVVSHRPGDDQGGASNNDQTQQSQSQHAPPAPGKSASCRPPLSTLHLC
jgi:hypothetical protein